MCTFIIRWNPDTDWPAIIACNRDEMIKRPSRPPGRHWIDRPDIVAGFDEEAGGSWLGINDYGVIAGILNRTDSLGWTVGKRSRGELILEALDHPDAVDAVRAVSEINGDAYRTFNMIVVDNRDAFWIKHDGVEQIVCHPLPIGTSMLTAENLNDLNAPRIAHHLEDARNAKEINPKTAVWTEWKSILSDRTPYVKDNPLTATNIETDYGFGTVSSSFLAIPGTTRNKPIWLFCDAPPDQESFVPVQI